MERFTGEDAVLLNMEDSVTPMHTLKIVVLDPSHRGAPLTLQEVHDAVLPRLGYVRRATERVARVRGFGGRPFWVDATDFDLWRHLDEVSLPAPGDRGQLDRLLGTLAERPVSRDHPLWAMTLVHGVDGGLQAVVVRVHHAIADGLASINVLKTITSVTRGQEVPLCPASPPELLDRRALRRQALRDARASITGVPQLTRTLRASRAAARSYVRRAEVPASMVPRGVLNAPSTGRRLCATAALDLGQVTNIAHAYGETVNGVFHTLIAAAVREELLARGEPVDSTVTATFGVSHDLSSTRRWGNDVATATAYLDVASVDPRARLTRTAKSCAVAVERRRLLGFEMTAVASDYLAGMVRLALPVVRRLPKTPNHVTTANVPGPRETRWFGDVKVVEWISFAVVMTPVDVNLTAHSYAGRIHLGLVCTPEALPDPTRFLGFLQPTADELLRLAAVGSGGD